MKKAISTPNQGPRSKIMSEKNRGQKSRVSVPLINKFANSRSKKFEVSSPAFIPLEAEVV